MITIIYTNGNKQLITPGGSFYATVVEKKYGTQIKQVRLSAEQYKAHVLDLACDIAIDNTHFDKQCCPVAKVLVSCPNGESYMRILNIVPSKEEFVPRADSYKKEQRKLWKKHKHDKLKPIMHFCVEPG